MMVSRGRERGGGGGRGRGRRKRREREREEGVPSVFFVDEDKIQVVFHGEFVVNVTV